jgi:WD40 repeat protein
MEFSPDSRTLAIGIFWQFCLWDVESGIQGYTHEKMSTPLTVSFAPDGLTLGVAVAGGKVQVRDTGSGDQVETLLATDKGYRALRLLGRMDDNVRSLVFRPASGTLVTVHPQGGVRLWNTRNRVLERTFEFRTRTITTLALSPDTQILAAGFEDGTIKLCNVKHGSTLTTIALGWTISELHFSADNHHLETSAGPLAINSDHSLQPGSGVLLGDEWVTFHGEKVLWLPVRYRQRRCSAANSDTLALGCHDGQVVVLKFSVPE